MGVVLSSLPKITGTVPLASKVIILQNFGPPPELSLEKTASESGSGVQKTIESRKRTIHR